MKLLQKKLYPRFFETQCTNFVINRTTSTRGSFKTSRFGPVTSVVKGITRERGSALTFCRHYC